MIGENLVVITNGEESGRVGKATRRQDWEHIEVDLGSFFIMKRRDQIRPFKLGERVA